MSEKKSDQNSFTGHLAELRSRLINSLIFIFIIFVIGYIFAENIYNFLVEPYAQAVKNDGVERRLIFTALHETFITYLKLAFFASIFLGSPIILTQIWKFVAPGLYKNEKKALLPYLIATPILFLLGGMLVYYLVMPLAIRKPDYFNSLPRSRKTYGLLDVQRVAEYNNIQFIWPNPDPVSFSEGKATKDQHLIIWISRLGVLASINKRGLDFVNILSTLNLLEWVKRNLDVKIGTIPQINVNLLQTS